MRRILVDSARHRLAQKRGSGAPHDPLDKALAVALEPDLNVVELNDALTELSQADPDSARVVELRCFGGLSIEETARCSRARRHRSRAAGAWRACGWCAGSKAPTAESARRPSL